MIIPTLNIAFYTRAHSYSNRRVRCLSRLLARVGASQAGFWLCVCIIDSPIIFYLFLYTRVCVSLASSEGVLAIVYAIVFLIVIIFRVSYDRWRHVSNAFSASVINIYVYMTWVVNFLCALVNIDYCEFNPYMIRK